MAIERTIEACLNKAVRGLELSGRTLIWEDPSWVNDEAAIWWRIDHAHDERVWAIMAALRRGAQPAEIARRSQIDLFFIEKLATIHAMERRLLDEPLTADLLWDAKRMGFSDGMIGALSAAPLYSWLGAGPAFLIGAITMMGLLTLSWILDPPSTGRRR